MTSLATHSPSEDQLAHLTRLAETYLATHRTDALLARAAMAEAAGYIAGVRSCGEIEVAICLNRVWVRALHGDE